MKGCRLCVSAYIFQNELLPQVSFNAYRSSHNGYAAFGVVLNNHAANVIISTAKQYM